MRADSDSASLRVELVDARAIPPLQLCLRLPPGSRLADALTAAGLRPDEAGAGIHGRRCEPQEPLLDGDRVELYRPLHADARARRRARVAAQRG